MTDEQITEENTPPPQETPERPTAKPRRRLPLSNSQIILLFLIIVGGRLIFDFSQRVVEGQEKISEVQALEQQVEALRYENALLSDAKSYYDSTSFVEAWAHSEGKMIKPGEILIIPMQDSSLPQDPSIATGPLTTPQQNPVDEWQVWWQLFFDAEPPPIR